MSNAIIGKATQAVQISNTLAALEPIASIPDNRRIPVNAWDSRRLDDQTGISQRPNGVAMPRAR